MTVSDTHADTIREVLTDEGVDCPYCGSPLGHLHPLECPEGLALTALDALVADLDREREAAANIKRDYDDVFGQLLRSHGERDRERARADRAEAALAGLVLLVRIGFLVRVGGKRATAADVVGPDARALLFKILQAKDVEGACAALSAGSGGRETT